MSPSDARSRRTYLNPPAQSRPKLSSEEQERALVRLRAGESYRAVAPDFGVSYGAISRLAQAARKRGAL
jgi:transposase